MKKFLLFILITVAGVGAISAQNAIIGSGFTNGWSNSADLVYFGASAGSTRILSLPARGTGNQYFRLVRGWGGNNSEMSPSASCSGGQDAEISTFGTVTTVSNANCGNSAYFINAPNTTDNYVFKTPDGASGTSFVTFRVQGAVRSISSVSRDVSSPIAGQNIVVTAALDGALSTGQDVYLRYTNNNYTPSTVVKMTGSGTSYSATIPSTTNTNGSTVSYYVFTSGNSNVAVDGSNADLYSINLNNNGGPNYSYAPSAANVLVTSTGGTGAAGVGYTTLGAAFTAINGGTAHTGAITVKIIADLNETTSAALTSAGSYTSINIQPVGNRTITANSGTGIAGALINLNGADNVTIDGVGLTGSNTLTLQNQSTTGQVIQLIADATTNTISKCTLKGANTSTSSGVLVLATGTATGNDANTIDGNNITAFSATVFPAIGIYSAGSASFTNSSVTINNNNIYDFFGSTSYGINISSNSTDFTISNNHFYKSLVSTTTATTLYGIYVATGNNHAITGNFIGGSSSNAGGSAWVVGHATTFINAKFYGIYASVGTTTATNISSNTISNIALSTTSGTSGVPGIFAGIYVPAGLVNIGTSALTKNIIGANNATGSIVVKGSTSPSLTYGIVHAGSGTYSIAYNEIGGITATGTTASGAASTSTSSGIVGIAATGTGTATISNNLIGSTSTANSINASAASTATSGQLVWGIWQSGAATSTISDNTIQNINNAYNGTGSTTTLGSTRAISIVNTLTSGTACAGTTTISGNTIKTITTANPHLGTGTTTATAGIYTFVSTPGNSITNNNISSISCTSTAAIVNTGIYFNSSSASASNTISRNNISNLVSSTTSNTGAVYGIHVGAGVSSIVNNVISLASPTTLVGSIIGINDFLGTNNYYHNSVYVGGSATNTGASTYAFNSSVTTNTRSFQNNIFYNARNNSASGGTAKHYAVKVSGTGANPTGLTMNNNIYFADGANGGVLGSYSTDRTTLCDWKSATGQDVLAINANPSFTNPTAATPDLHLTGTTPAESAGANLSIADDIDGAGTRSGTTPDIGADEGSFTASDLTGPIVAFTAFTSTISLSNRTVSATISDAGSGVGAVRLWYKKSTETDAYGANDNTFNGWKYVTGTLASGSTYNFTIDYTLLNSSLAVGNSIQYFFTAQDLAGTPNANSVGVTFNAGYCIATAALSSAPTTSTAANSFTILPSLGGTYYVGAASCSGNSPNYATLTAAVAAYNSAGLTGAVTFLLTDATYSTSESFPIVINANVDANATNTLTIKPCTGVTTTITGATGVTTSAPIILNGADYVTIDGSNSVGGTTKNLTITNSNTGGTAGIWLRPSSATTGVGATNNTIKNCIITTGVTTSNISYGIHIGSFSALGSAGEDNDNNTITNNTISSATIGIFAKAVSNAGSSDNLIISDNILSGPSTSSSTGLKGLDLAYLNNATINGNTINAYLSSGGGNPIGILLGTNVLNTSITRNQINNIKYTGIGGYGGKGIDINTTNATSALTIANNMISDIGGDSYSGTSDGIYGIRIQGTNTGGINLYYNSINLTGSASNTQASSISAALFISTTSATNLDIRNNIFANSIVSSSTTGKAYAIYSAAVNTAFSNINYNDYYVSGTQGVLGFLSSDRTDLTGTQTGFGQNANSINADPFFTSATNLHANATQIDGTGTPIGAVTTDFDGETRNATTPDMGADEFAAAGMSYVSSTVTQNSTAINAGATAQQVIGIQVVTTGTASPINLTKLAVNVNGTTAAANVANAKIYYTGTSSTYAATTAFGSTVAAPTTANFDVTGSQTLAYGTNYFWLVLDVNATAPNASVVDAECTAITVAGTDYTPSVTAPVGTRTVVGKTVTSVTVTQASTAIAIAGVANQALLRVAVIVAGPSTSTLNLNSIDVNNNGTADADVSGVKLFNTLTSTTFATTTQLGTTQTFSATNASFTSLNYNFPVGTTYLWIAYDIATNATVNNVADAQILANGININGTPYNSVADNPVGARTIKAPLKDTYLIGAGKTAPNYTNLTTAITDLNAYGVGNAVTFLLDNDYSSTGETYPLAINSIIGGSSTNTLTIKPNTGVTATISGSVATSILKLNGADYVTIDGSNAGGTDRSLSITNTNASGTGVVWLASTATPDGATNNTIKNCNITGGSTTTSFGIFSGGTSSIATGTTGSGNNNNTYQNNDIKKCQYGIFTTGNSTTKNTGTTIAQNKLDNASPNNIGQVGIAAYYENGISITENTVGSFTNSGSVDVLGISLGSIGISNTTFTASGEVINATVSRNKVYAITQSNTYSAGGIIISGAASGTSTISNNYISSIVSTGTSGDFGVGIFAHGGTGSVTNIYYNTVVMDGTLSSAAFNSFALAMGSTPTINVKNNILVNTQTGFGTSYRGAAIGVATITYTSLLSDNNVLYSSGTATGIISALNTTTTTNFKDFANWKSTTSKDASSFNVSPVFTTAPTLNKTSGNNCSIRGKGTPIAGITTDYDVVDTRDATNPGIGADEYGGVLAAATATGTTPACVSTTLTATPASGVSYAWGNTGGVISGETAVTYSATASSTYTVTVTETTSGCTVASAGIPIVINPLPTTPTITGNASFCTGGSTTLTSSASTGNQWLLSGSPISGETAATYVANAAGDYSVRVTDGNSCSATSTVTSVTVNTLPTTPTISGNASFCTGGSTTLTSSASTGNQWLLSGSPISGETAATYVANAAGDYSVRVTDGNSCSATSTVTSVTVNTPASTAVLAGNATITSGNSTNLTVTITGGATPYTVIYNDGSGNVTVSSYTSGANIAVSPTSTTTYTLVSVTDANGCVATTPSGTAVVTVGSAGPTAAVLSGTATICSGGSTNLQVAITGGASPYTVVYSDGTNNITVNSYASAANISVSPNATTTYTLVSVTDNNSVAGTGLSGNAVVTVNALPSLTTSAITPICGATTADLTSVVTSNGTVTYFSEATYTTPVADATAVTTAQTYYVRATSTGCTTTGSIVVNAFKANPNASISNNNGLALSCTTPSTTLTASGGTSYLWSDASTNAALTVSTAGTFLVTVTGSNGCTATSTATTTSDKTAPNASISNNNGLALSCTVPSTTLTASGGASYVWNDITNATTAAVQTSVAATFVVTVTGSNGCTVTATATTTSDKAAPSLTVSGAISPICGATTANLTSAVMTNGTATYFSDAAFANSVTTPSAVTTAQTYYVIATGSNGCTTTGSIVVNAFKANPTTPTISGTAYFCTGGSTTLTSSAATDNQWYENGYPIGGGTNQTLNVTASGSYTVVVMAANGCTATSTATTVTVGTPATAAVLSNSGNNLIVTITGGTAPFTVVYSDGTNNSTVTSYANGANIPVFPAVTTTYSLVSITDASACSASGLSGSAIISGNVGSSAAVISGTATICNGVSTNLQVAISGGTSPYTVIYSDGTNNTTVTAYASGANIAVSPTSTTTYTLISVTDAGSNTGSGLSGSAVVTVNQPTSNSTTATACNTYTWSVNGTTYTTSGTYTATSTNAAGCPHTETLNLTINSSTSNTTTATACNTYTWSVNSQVYTTSGTYVVTSTNVAGCVHTETLNLTINSSTSNATTATACDTYTWSANGTTYTTSGTYTATSTNAAGCPHTETLNLTINGSTTSSVSATACDTYTWAANGQTYTTSGTYTATSTNAAGCPHVTTLNLTINGSTTSSVSAIACDTYTWAANGQTYTTSGIYTATSTNAAGCPHTETLNLTINGSTTSSVSASACDTYTWALNGTTYTTSGAYTHTSTNAAGCPHTETLNLTINRLSTASIASSNGLALSCTTPSTILTASGGVSYIWNDATTATTAAIQVATAGTFTVTVTDVNGCKATVSRTTTLNTTAPSPMIANNNGLALSCTIPSTTLTASGGSTFLWSTAAITGAIAVATAGTFTVTVTGANGCTATTSVVVTSDKTDPTVDAGADVVVNCTNPSTILNATGTGGIVWDNGATQGGTVSPSTTTTYTVTITAANGCTATDMVVVTVDKTAPNASAGADVILTNINTSATLTASGGISYLWSTTEMTASISVNNTVTTAYQVTVTGANGCTATDEAVAFYSNSDLVGPTFTFVPANTSTNCQNAGTIADATASAALATATDNLPGVVVTCNQVSTKGSNSASCDFYTYTITNTWTATDAANNTATASQVIMVRDVTAPVLSAAPANVTVTQTGSTTPVTLTATDNCAIPTVTVATTVSSTGRPACYSVYENRVNTWTATDACGNTSTAKQIVTVADLVQLTCPGNIILATNADGVNNYNCATVVKAANNVAPIFSDICDLSVLRHSVSGVTTILNGNGTVAGLTFNKGLSTVTYTALGRTCSFTIEVKDTELPKISTTNSTVVEDACTFSASPASPAASDNCATNTFVVSSATVAAVNGCSSKAATLKYFSVSTRTWTATDAAGNTATRIQKVYLRDMAAPIAICKDVTVFIGTSNISVAAVQFNNGSYDNCAGNVLSYAVCRVISPATSCTNFASNLSLTPSMIPTGSNTVTLPVTLRVTDPCGNVATCNANIILKRVGTSANNNTTTTLAATTADSPNETPVTPEVPSDIDATHGSMKCFPNPFSDDLNINYNLTTDVEKIVVKVYDNQGRLVKMNEQGESLAGYYRMTWNLSDLQSGMYHICLEADGKCLKVERVVLTK